MTYEEACGFIENIGRFSVKNSNAHTRLALTGLGSPDLRFPSIHVAGTNGKGSVCAYLASVMRESGRKVGRFTSPHLVRINERINVGGEDISDADFTRVFAEVEDVCAQMKKDGCAHPSYFEFLFLMAMVYFAEENVDIAVIETGLGGRLDATNALLQPLLSVITSISFDHMQYLGNTIPEIAAEKAGIIKPGVPVVYDAGNEEAARVIREKAAAEGAAAAALAPEEIQILWQDGGDLAFSLPFDYDGRHEFRVHSRAPYQAENAALAVLALKMLRNTHPSYRDLSAEVAEKGIAGAYWPARMEEIAPRVFLDGAHNDDGIRRFAAAARGIAGEEPVILVFAAVRDKDSRGMIRILAGELHFHKVLVTEAGGARKTDPGILAGAFSEAGVPAEAVPDAGEAVRRAVALGKREHLSVFICGSLYLAGEVKREIRESAGAH